MPGDDELPPDDETPDEGLLDDESLPEGWFKWAFTHVRRLANISTEIGKLTAENRRLRMLVIRLAADVNHHAGRLDQINQTIKARVEAEVLKRLKDLGR